MPSFSFFSSSRRKEKAAGRRVLSASPTPFYSRENSPSPEPIPPIHPPFQRRGSEPAAPFSRDPGSRLPPIVLYSADGPSISGRASAPILSPPRFRRTGSDTRSDTRTPPPERQYRIPTPSPVSPPRIPSPPLPPHPATAAAASVPRPGMGAAAARAASFNHSRPLRAAGQPRPRSRSFGTDAITKPPSCPLPTAPSTSPIRPPRPASIASGMIGRPPFSQKHSLPQLDMVWNGFLEEAQEAVDTLSDLPNGSVYDTLRPSPRRPGAVRAATDPPKRPLPDLPPTETTVLQRPRSAGNQQSTLGKPPTPPLTPGFAAYRLPPLSPLDALDVSVSLACGLGTAPSEASLNVVSVSASDNNLSVMSLFDTLNNSISLSAFPKPPQLDALEEEAVQRAEAAGNSTSLPYLGPLPTPPISPDSLLALRAAAAARSKDTTVRTTARRRDHIPSFGKSMDAAERQNSGGSIGQDAESSSDESHYTLARHSVNSSPKEFTIPYRAPLERSDSSSSISSTSSDADGPATFESSSSSGRSSRSTTRTTSSTPRAPSHSPRSSFEFDEPPRVPRAQGNPPAKTVMHMDLPPVPFVANMDLGPITPKNGEGTPSMFQLGWSPATGTVEYGYAV